MKTKLIKKEVARFAQPDEVFLGRHGKYDVIANSINLGYFIAWGLADKECFGNTHSDFPTYSQLSPYVQAQIALRKLAE